MKYQVFISGAPKKRQARHAGGDGASRISGERAPRISGDGASARVHDHDEQVPEVKRYPPVLQMLTDVEPSFERQMNVQAMAAFRQGKDINQICEELFYCAISCGYDATLGVQEIYSTSMPSFPNQTVLSTLLMVDAKKKGVTPGYRRRWTE